MHTYKHIPVTQRLNSNESPLPDYKASNPASTDWLHADRSALLRPPPLPSRRTCTDKRTQYTTFIHHQPSQSVALNYSAFAAARLAHKEAWLEIINRWIALRGTGDCVCVYAPSPTQDC